MIWWIKEFAVFYGMMGSAWSGHSANLLLMLSEMKIYLLWARQEFPADARGKVFAVSAEVLGF